METTTYKLDDRIELIDLFDLGEKNRTGAYLIKEEELTIIETSASPSIPYLLGGLKKLNVDPVDIKYIIVTHIHLDHSGGAGLFLQHCPNAKVIVHPRGYRHLANPERLISSSKEVYGEKDFARLFDPIVPIPEDRIEIKNNGDELKIGENCTLTFYDTPGHCKHHFSIFDPVSNGIFSGDTIGIYYKLKDFNIDLFLPATSPNQFEPDVMLDSIQRIEDLRVERIYFGHFGMSTDTDKVYSQIRYWIPLFVQAGRDALNETNSKDNETLTPIVITKLLDVIIPFLYEKGVPKNDPALSFLSHDLQVSAMGIVDYLLKQSTAV